VSPLRELARVIVASSGHTTLTLCSRMAELAAGRLVEAEVVQSPGALFV